MGPAPFGDLAKPALDVLGDDYTKKFLLKAKSAPSALPLSLTIEDEVGPKGVEGTLTAKWKEPTTGITFDKIKLKGTKVNYEASKSIEKLKLKAKGDPTDLNSTSGSAELKGPSYALTAGADKSKVTCSLAALLFPGAVAGGEASYALSGGAVAYSCGASYALPGTLFGSLIYNSKKIFSLALCWSPLPKLSFAASVDSDKKAPTVGLKYGVAPSVTVGAKTTKETLSLVYVNKLGKDASIVVSAESKFADLATAKPTLGCTLTVG
eukprot:CAMPEP_0118897114 /NCGR_PEP_ID=MMETSP1166-20130328/4651_1 /TAXON_ID=1104430 /ORGANISM="Chrysoreinhardia sp, Strain CCMP3193" /LENGTH=265 /DNA_ID=CAMNT_0006836181 /DNA_START=72 /DNA_END=872 /DNA_ORIENTATION=+